MRNFIIILFALGFIGCGDVGEPVWIKVAGPNEYYDDYLRFEQLVPGNEQGHYYDAYCLHSFSGLDEQTIVRRENAVFGVECSCVERFATIEDFTSCMETCLSRNLDTCFRETKQWYNFFGTENTLGQTRENKIDTL